MLRGVGTFSLKSSHPLVFVKLQGTHTHWSPGQSRSHPWNTSHLEILIRLLQRLGSFNFQMKEKQPL